MWERHIKTPMVARSLEDRDPRRDMPRIKYVTKLHLILVKADLNRDNLTILLQV
jgi:hypothetical protein